MTVFVSYSHKDKATLERLLTHLRPLMRGDDAVSVWTDQKISVSQKWRAEIEAAIAVAEVAILLISANFYESDFIVNDELKPLLEKERRGECKIFCLLVGPSAFSGDEILSSYQAMPSPNKTLLEHPSSKRDRILQEFASEVRGILRLRISEARTIRKDKSKHLDHDTLLVPDKSISNLRELNIDFGRYFNSSYTDLRGIDGETWEGLLIGKMFENCTIVGPGIICPVDGCSFVKCTFDLVDNDPKSVLLKPVGDYFCGVLAIRDCIFENCKFVDLGFTGEERVLRELESAIKRSPK